MKEKIYLIPGLMTNHKLWSRLEPHLDEYELIHLPIPATDNFDEIIESYHEQISCEQANILGFSLGGYIASYFAVNYPQRVKRIFLLGATPTATEEKNIEHRTKKLQMIKQYPFQKLQKEKVLDISENKEDDELVDILMDMYDELGHENLICQVSSTLNRKNLCEELPSLDIPIKFFYSENDRLLDHDSLNKMKNKEHHITFVKREGISHNLPLEVPKDVSHQIKEWMK